MTLTTLHLNSFNQITDSNGNRYVIKLGTNHYAITFDGSLGSTLLSGTTITDIILDCEGNDNNRAVRITEQDLIVIETDDRSYAIVVDGFTIVEFIELD